MAEKFLAVADVARELRRTPALVRYLANTGALRSLRTVGGMRIFRRSDVDRFKRARAKEAAKREAAMG